MSDPYKVLGLNRDASDDDVKKAYRTLSRKYHPDSNVDNPNKEKAEEMFKLVQQAYEQIMAERSGKTSGAYGSSGSYSSSGSSYSGGSYSGNPFGGFGPFGSFGDFMGGFGDFTGSYTSGRSDAQDEESIRMRAAGNYIQNRHFREALNVLTSVTNRNAQWYYYSAMANAGLGNNVTAREHAKTACDMEPYNTNYRSLYNRLNGGGEWYNTQRSPYGGMYTNINTDYCTRLCLMNLAFNLCCGVRFC